MFKLSNLAFNHVQFKLSTLRAPLIREMLTHANMDQCTGMDYKHGSQIQIIKDYCTEVMVWVFLS